MELFNIELLNQIRTLIYESRERAVRAVDHERTLLYWHIGQYVYEEQQQGKRAEYGKQLINFLVVQLEPEFGSGYGQRQLYLFVQFYRAFPIVNAVRSQLNWTQYRVLSRIESSDKREFYMAETTKNHWTSRQMERQVNSLLYERMLLSSDKESVLAVARGEKQVSEVKEIVKDPMYLEFLGLKRESSYYEKDLEQAIITHLQDFLLEMGNGYSFVARQKRILLEDDEFFVDLVFYNRLLQCFVVIEIKTHKLTHQDVGQLQMYVNYFDRIERLPHENPTIGILLCTNKNDTVVKFSLPEGEKQIVASKYELVLPTEKQLLEAIKTEIGRAPSSEL